MSRDKGVAWIRMDYILISILGFLLVIAGAVLGGVIISQALNIQADLLSWFAILTPSAILIAVGLLLALLPFLLYPLTKSLLRQERDVANRFEQFLGAMENQRDLLEQIRETNSLSDAAKQIAYRAKDRETLRTAIREDIEKGDFEAAIALVEEMQSRFGYRKEAEDLREEIETSWRSAKEKAVGEMLQQIEAAIARSEWKNAQRLTTKLVRIYPDHPEALRMPERIEVGRDNQKRELLKQWKDAITRDDVNQSIELLKQLDQYLSPSEAEAYKESARDVFKKRLQQLGVQFALHVHDRNWNDAVRIGRQITEEFPNTRMAQEVREKMVILERKASEPVRV